MKNNDSDPAVGKSPFHQTTQDLPKSDGPGPGSSTAQKAGTGALSELEDYPTMRDKLLFRAMDWLHEFALGRKPSALDERKEAAYLVDDIQLTIAAGKCIRERLLGGR